MRRNVLRKIIVSIIIIFVMLTLAFCYFFIPNPFKIIDPAHPKFRAENFEFKDYKDLCSLEKVLAKMFPLGTNKSYVDQILLRKNSGVSELETQDGSWPDLVSYTYIPLFPSSIFIYPNGISINVIYDQSNNIEDMLTPFGVFPGSSVYSQKSCK